MSQQERSKTGERASQTHPFGTRGLYGHTF